MPKLRKVGTWVYVPDEKTCRDSFSSWPSTRVFQISQVSKSYSGAYYYWVNSYSKGLRSHEVVSATPEQVKAHLKLYKKDGTPRKRTVTIKKEITQNSTTTVVRESMKAVSKNIDEYLRIQHETVPCLRSRPLRAYYATTNCPNKNCEGGVIVAPHTKTFNPRLCKKCNPSPKRTTAAFNVDTYPKLYSYLIWCNYHENLWYAIPRSEVSKFFSGKASKKNTIYAHDFPTLISKVK
jgi:hypothetical protein